VSLRERVSELRRRREEAQVNHALLSKLRVLWELACAEIEAEVQEGVRKQLGLDVSVDRTTSAVSVKQHESLMSLPLPMVVHAEQQCVNAQDVVPQHRASKRARRCPAKFDT